MDLIYVPSNRMWYCHTWAEVFDTIAQQYDGDVHRYNVVEYHEDGKTSFFAGNDLMKMMDTVLERKSLASTKRNVPTFEGSPIRYDEELVDRNKRFT